VRGGKTRPLIPPNHKDMIMSVKFETSDERIAYCTKEFGPPKTFRLSRFGDLDIVFEGWEVSVVDEEQLRKDRATVDVSTFFSTKGSYIAQITRHMPNHTEGKPHVVKSKSDAFSTPRQLLEWLKTDGRGWLGENSKVAWEEMCSRLPWLSDSNAVRV